MDDAFSNPTAKGDIEQQMKNCYADLKKILDHYNASFDDVIVENIFTTDMKAFYTEMKFNEQDHGKRISFP